MRYELGKCSRGCGPFFCCCKLTHYGLGPAECRCRCHAKEIKDKARLRVVKIRTGMSY